MSTVSLPLGLRARSALAERVHGLDAAWTCLIAVATARTVAALALGVRPLDDAYITYRYALNLGDGHGLVYNVGDHVLGTTTPLWSAILGGAHWVGLSLPSTSLVLALACDIGTALLLRSLLDRLGFGRAIAFGAPIAWLCVADVLGISRSGMETSLFVFTILLVLDQLSRRRLVSASAAAAAAVLIRPEGLIAAGVVVLWTVLMWRDLPRRRIALAAGVLAAIVGAWVAFATIYYGSPVPQSVVAKAAHDNAALSALSNAHLKTFLEDAQPGGLGNLKQSNIEADFLLTLGAGVATLALGWSALRRRHRRGRRALERLVLLVAFPLAYGAALAAGHAFTSFPWYYEPLFPFYVALALIGVAQLPLGRRRGVAVAGAAALVCTLQIVALVHVKLPAEHRDHWVAGLGRAAALIPRSDDAPVVADEIGEVGWRTYPRPVEDLQGLVMPSAVHESATQVLLRDRPGYVVLQDSDLYAADLMRRLDRPGALHRQYGLSSSFVLADGATYRLYTRRQ